MEIIVKLWFGTKDKRKVIFYYIVKSGTVAKNCREKVESIKIQVTVALVN